MNTKNPPPSEPFMMQGVDEGRIFYRHLKDNQSCLLGVVRIQNNPWLGQGAHTQPMECVMAARLNSKLWLDLEHPDPLSGHIHFQESIPEMTPSDFIKGMQWRSGAMSDAFQVALREAPIPDDGAGKWAIVFAGLNKNLEVMPKDGLYELSADGVKLIDDRAFVGSGINQVLREPIWGPGGQFGLLTGMRHDVYDAFIANDRVRTSNRDPRFAEFLELMKEVDPLPLAYTATQFAQHEEAANRVTSSMLARERISEMEGLAKALGIKPAQ